MNGGINMANLKDVKVGDKVILRTGGWFPSESVEVVEKITPKGYIKVSGQLYMVNDEGESASAKGSSSAWLYPWTEEYERKIKEKRYINQVKRKMNDYNGKLTFEQAKQISEILKF